uniref:Sema domain-containing protein n=1 Tax=Ascaris lumbricoides TaxID=6252 RepID=A0A9J2PAX3_ASCLU
MKSGSVHRRILEFGPFLHILKRTNYVLASPFQIIFTESDGILRRILRRRLCKPNTLDASSEGIPRSTEFLYSGDHRIRPTNGTTLRLFRVPETSHIRYYVSHSDELGLHGGFIMWPNLTLFKIKGRHLRDLEVRFKTASRPAQFQYVDVSRLWNNGEDLNLTKGIDRLGKEWQFAFRTLRARTKCIESKGMDCDLHILWRYNRRLQYVYRRTEMRNNLMDEKELFFLSRAKPFKGSIFVGLRNGILFICPAKENMISINHMFNDAGFFAKENPDLIDWHLSTRKKIYLVSQHFREVFVVAVNDNGTYYKAFSTFSDSLRAHTVDLSAFTHIPWLKFFMNSTSLVSVDLSSNHLYFYYGSESWCIPLGKDDANAQKEDAPDSPLITDTFTGQRVAKKYDGGIIDTINIAHTYYDSLLILRTAEFMDTIGHPLIYGIKDCYLFAAIEFGHVRFPNRPEGDECLESSEGAVCLQNLISTPSTLPRDHLVREDMYASFFLAFYGVGARHE